MVRSFKFHPVKPIYHLNTKLNINHIAIPETITPIRKNQSDLGKVSIYVFKKEKTN